MDDILEKFIGETKSEFTQMNKISNEIKGVELLFKRGNWPTVHIEFDLGSLIWCEVTKRIIYDCYFSHQRKPLLEHKIEIRKVLHKYLKDLMEESLKKKNRKLPELGGNHV